MNIRELIGKMAIRTKPTKSGDYSYTNSGIKILKVTDTHILHQCNYSKDNINILINDRWDDDCWEDYDKLMEIN